MADAPRYKTSVDLREAPSLGGQASQSAFAQKANIGESLSRAVGRMADFEFRRMEQEQTIVGARMAQEQGARPTLRGLAAKGGPQTIAEREAYRVANEIAATEVETEALRKMTELSTQAEINKTPFTQFQAQMADIVDGFPAAISDLDPATAGVLRARLGSAATDAEMRYSSFYNKLQISEIQGRALQGIAAREQNIDLFAGSDAYTPEGLEQKLTDMAEFMRLRQFDEKDISTAIVGLRTRAKKAEIIGAFQRLPDYQSKTAYLEQLQKKPPKELGVEDTRTLSRSLQTELGNHTTFMKSAATQLSADIKNARDVLEKGGDPGQEQLVKMLGRMEQLGEFGAKQREELQSLTILRDGLLSFRKMAPAQMIDNINQLRAGIQGIGGPGMDTEVETDLVNAADKLYNTAKKELASDPLTYAARVGVIDFNPLSIGESDEETIASFTERKQAAKDISNWAKVDVKFFTDAEASAITNQLKNGDSVQRLGLLGQMVEVFDTDSPDAFAQIAEKDPQLAHIGGLMVLGQYDNARIALEGFDLIADKDIARQVGITKPTNTDQDFIDIVGPAFVNLPETRASTFEIAKAIYTKHAVDRGLDDFDSSLWEQSIQQATGNSLHEVRDRITLLPVGVDPADVEEALDNLSAETVQAQTGNVISEARLEQIRESSFFGDDFGLEAVGADQYQMVIGDKGTGNYRVVRSDNDEPIILSVKDLVGQK